MEVYILDGLLRRIEVIDIYESLIWTERWREKGEVELVVEATQENVTRLVDGTMLATNESDRVMIIDYTENDVDDDGRQILTVHGKSLEKLLEGRTATDGLRGLVPDASDWILTGTPGNVAREIFQKICVDGILSAGDIIPFIKPGVLHPPGNIQESQLTFSVAIPLSTVYDAIKELCDQYDMGFRLVRNLDKSELYFEIYTGSDRTASQTTLTPVIFSPSLGNLSNVKEVTSTEDYKNVAYVFSKNGALAVYADGAGPDTSGFDRRVMYVDVNNVDEPAGPALDAILFQKGSEELAKHRSVSAFDGEVSKTSEYKYGLHYHLGDLVEMRKSDGGTNRMRVTEQIFVSDVQGDRSYPTLSIQSYIMPGTWSSWDANEVWQEADGTWAIP